MNKAMTAKRMREIAALMVSKAQKADETARAAEKVADMVRKGIPLELNGHRYTQEEVDRYAEQTAKEAAEWKPLRMAAYELQEHSFTMKG